MLEIEKAHYGIGFKIILPVLIITLLILSFIKVYFVVVSLLLLPALIVFFLWVFRDKTVVKLDSSKVFVKEVNRTFSDEFSVSYSKIINCHIVNVNFINKGSRTTEIGLVTSDWSNKVYKKNVIVIQTKAKSYRIGRDLNDVDLLSIFREITKRLGSHTL
jgi:hypothetical protein|tara:strand:- start:138 stop:617 length:480 start_codon:yes stop_codon:yes gene_type:complete